MAKKKASARNPVTQAAAARFAGIKTAGIELNAVDEVKVKMADRINRRQALLASASGQQRSAGMMMDGFGPSPGRGTPSIDAYFTSYAARKEASPS